MLRFLEQFNLFEDSIQIRWTASTFQTNERLEAQIDREWKSALEKPGVNLFDGPMCRMESWRLSEDRRSLTLNLSSTTYRHFVGTNFAIAKSPETPILDSMLARPVGVSPALISSDGFLLLGRRNGSVAYYPHRLHPFAGAVEFKPDVDLFAEVRRELREELSLAVADVPEIRCTGIVEDVALRQSEMIFAARSTLSRSQIEAQLDRDEHQATWACRATADGIAVALRSEESFTPVAVAAMLLFGRIEFGDDWFHESAARFQDPCSPLTTHH